MGSVTSPRRASFYYRGHAHSTVCHKMRHSTRSAGEDRDRKGSRSSEKGSKQVLATRDGQDDPRTPGKAFPRFCPPGRLEILVKLRRVARLDAELQSHDRERDPMFTVSPAGAGFIMPGPVKKYSFWTSLEPRIEEIRPGGRESAKVGPARKGKGPRG